MSLLKSILGTRQADPDAQSWAEVVSKLIDAVFALVKAEASGLREDVGQTGKVLRSLAVKLALLVALVLVGAGTFTASALLGLSMVMHPALAALCIGVVAMALAAIAAFSIRRSVTQLEPPTQTVRRRLSSHLDWWREEVRTVARPDSGPRVTHLNARKPDDEVKGGQ